MKMTSLCYLEYQDRYLMLLRNKKKEDENEGKWIGIGGKFEAGEAPDVCARREIFEECGLCPRTLRFRGIIIFQQNNNETEYMHLFTGKVDSPSFKECSEGELHWIPKAQVCNLNLWEGDHHFLKLLQNDSPFFFMTLQYDGDRLVDSKVNYPAID